MIEEWMKEIKAKSPPEGLGMILVHNGIVRATSKKGEPVRGMLLGHDEDLLRSLVQEYSRKDGIVGIRVWINDGNLKIGDDIMVVLVAGRFRTDVLPVFESLIRDIKTRVVREEEAL
ncbi:MAG TPA: molybdopterin converting factor [Deltaproteobacteria bacterium]|nr:molybdopterin converting factor [Deltaproteobacteria bacterium]